jgi:hypothetical protein
LVTSTCSGEASRPERGEIGLVGAEADHRPARCLQGLGAGIAASVADSAIAPTRMEILAIA